MNPSGPARVNDLFSSLYLLAKVFSALLTALSIAVFTRQVGQHVYGEYLIGFAFAFIVYSVVSQWLLGAHFGQQSRKQAARIAGGAIVLTGVSTLVGVALMMGAALLGLFDRSIAPAAVVLLIGLSFYFVANEIGRAQLLAVPVMVSTVVRNGAILGLGSLALWAFHSASALLAAVAVAHMLAVAPILFALRRTIWRGGFVWPERADYGKLWRYGAPLIIAGGAAAVAAFIDRIMLDHYFGAEAVGSYGAPLDFIKQSFVVIGEAIAISYVSMAKSFHGDGHEDDRRRALIKAFTTVIFFGAFGIVFYVLFGELLLSTMMGAKYHDAIGLAPLFAFGGAVLIVKAYYFGQSIYFANSVRLELISTLMALASAAALSFLLIPRYSILGAGIAFVASQVIALLVFLVSAKARDLMPVDIRRMGVIVAVAGAVAVLGEIMKVAAPAMATPVNLAMAALASGWLMVRWDLFDAGKIWAGLLATRRFDAGR